VLLKKEMGHSRLPDARPSQSSGGRLFAPRLPISGSVAGIANHRFSRTDSANLIARNRERGTLALSI
jgi:hypothetical protein